jgi:hypothetical protein
VGGYDDYDSDDSDDDDDKNNNSLSTTPWRRIGGVGYSST